MSLVYKTNDISLAKNKCKIESFKEVLLTIGCIYRIGTWCKGDFELMRLRFY